MRNAGAREAREEGFRRAGVRRRGGTGGIARVRYSQLPLTSLSAIHSGSHSGHISPAQDDFDGFSFPSAFFDGFGVKEVVVCGFGVDFNEVVKSSGFVGSLVFHGVTSPEGF